MRIMYCMPAPTGARRKTKNKPLPFFFAVEATIIAAPI
jgi:hypothetical protein